MSELYSVLLRTFHCQDRGFPGPPRDRPDETWNLNCLYLGTALPPRNFNIKCLEMKEKNIILNEP